ncbi:2-phospho-L-lactate guanylyltransferase [Bradyrhizobium vignae]|uniref:2-phospho-L-lactate guanylyltransferase n=1 Tax=Bradyrhizobium vignae TaxID=1549949 RepID=UPI00100A5929|nr:2-phospho-L-lactate guanylyltransferase [Bradyrhizobium vignae]RXG97231.1 2-phospho-L-lactate guanylyltransferase [Bradyrhizobium vignae]
MRTVVAIPMKDPAESKTRLADALTAAQREKMVLALFRRVQSFFGTQFPDFERLVVTPSPRVASEATACSAVALVEESTRGLNNAAQSAFSWAKKRGFDRLLIVPADIPIWLRSEVDELIGDGQHFDVVVARAHDGGTNALLINLVRTDRFEFCYGVHSARRHAEAASAASLSSIARQWPFLGHDIDTVDDCLVLTQKLSSLTDAS